MTLNHVNLTVNDPLETSEFLSRYFGLQPVGGNAGMQLLRDDNGMVLTLMKARHDDTLHSGPGHEPHEGRPRQGVRYPSSFHIGFIQQSPGRVDDINKRLRDDGFDVGAPAHLHGSWTFYFQAPGGFTVEVLA